MPRVPRSRRISSPSSFAATAHRPCRRQSLRRLRLKFTVEIDHTAAKFAYGKAARYRVLDHTLITRNESVGVIGRKRAACFHLYSTTYDWFGRGQVARNGFDSR